MYALLLLLNVFAVCNSWFRIHPTPGVQHVINAVFLSAAEAGGAGARQWSFTRRHGLGLGLIALV